LCALYTTSRGFSRESGDEAGGATTGLTPGGWVWTAGDWGLGGGVEGTAGSLVGVGTV